MITAVINPAGSNGGTMKVWKQAEKILNERNIEYRAYFSSPVLSIKEIVHRATDTDQPVTLLVFGGDGTMNLVVNGIQNFENTRVGFISCGSGNDLARSLSLPENVSDCMDLILRDEVRHQLDVGETVFHNRYDAEGNMISEEEYIRRFNISSGIGFDAEICAKAETSRLKKILNAARMGKLIYITVAVKVIFSAVRVRAKITADEKQTDYKELLFAAAMNEPYEGGGFRFAPKADPSDGRLDLCAADSLSQFDFFRIFPYAYSGAHVRFQGVYINKCEESDICTEIPMWVHTDGEIEYMSSHVTFRLSGKKLNLLI